MEGPMTAPDPNQTPTAPTPDARGGPAAEPAPDQPLTRLRGASVDIDGGRAAEFVLGACLLAVAVAAVILLIAGVQKNNQIDSLRDHGVPVAVHVDKCVGLLGGSGSNGAGYACTGSYTVGRRHLQEAIPGNGLLAPGAVIRGVTVVDDPALLSTPAQLATEHASWNVYLAPAILFVVLIVLAALFVVRHRRRAAGGAPAETAPMASR